MGFFLSQALLLAAVYGLFCLALACHVVIVFLSQGASATFGWYLYAVVTVEVILLALGASVWVGRERLRHAIGFGAFLLAALDLYAVHFLLGPYYAGVIAHRPDGPLRTFLLGDLSRTGIGELISRLTVNKPAILTPAVFSTVWVLYAGATLLLVFLAFLASRSGRRGTADLDSPGPTD